MNTHNLLAITLFVFCPLVCAVGITAQQPPENDQDYFDAKFGAGDDAFTEPIEEIKVATAEMGIVKKIHVKKGDTVGPNDLLIELDMSVLEATRRIAESKANNKARIKAAEIEFQIKNTRYEKLVSLVRDGAGSPEEGERALADTQVAKQNIEALLEEAEQHRLEVQQYEAQMERRRIRSPIHGQVVEIRKKVGEHISNNDPHIVTVVRFDTLRAIFHIATAKAIKMQKGDIVEVVVPETNQRTRAEVEFVAPITQADSGRVRVDVTIDNQTHEFRSGVRCRLVGGIVRATSNLRHQR